MAQCYRNSGSLKNGMAAQAHRTSGSFAPRLFILYLHSKKPDFLKQEIYGNLILYNFGIFLANEAALEKQKQQLEIEQQHQSQNKYHYQVDFSSALRIARKYFWRDSRTEKDIIHLMIKYVHAVKEELRQFSRPLRGIGAVHFAFR